MNRRRALALAAIATLPVATAATPALAGPPLQQAKPVVEGEFDGTLRRLNIRANFIKLTDRSIVRWDEEDEFHVQHLFDTEPSENGTFCDLFDSGGERLAQAFVDAGYTLRVNGTIFRPRSEVSSIFVTANTCDGVVDEDDVSPTVPLEPTARS
jgi:hypothetical protein